MFNDKYGLTTAVLDGRKTMTRRIIPIDLYNSTDWGAVESGDYIAVENRDGDFIDIRNCGNYSVGEVVAIAQSYEDAGFSGDEIDREPKTLKSRGLIRTSKGWNNKMFVRAEAIPNHIRIIDIKVERLQYISDEDCMKEGIIRRDDCINSRMEDIVVYTFENSFVRGVYKTYPTPREAFAALIDKVSGKGTWKSNPWVFVYSFELID